MKKTPYRNARIGHCSQWSEINKGWMPVATIWYFSRGRLTENQILSKDGLIFPTFEGANEHTDALAKRWIGENL